MSVRAANIIATLAAAGFVMFLLGLAFKMGKNDGFALGLKQRLEPAPACEPASPARCGTEPGGLNCLAAACEKQGGMWDYSGGGFESGKRFRCAVVWAVKDP